MTTGVDAVELRVDLLKSPKECVDFSTLCYFLTVFSYSVEFVQEQVAVLRRHCHLPIIFTGEWLWSELSSCLVLFPVRSKGQGGRI